MGPPHTSARRYIDELERAHKEAHDNHQDAQGALDEHKEEIEKHALTKVELDYLEKAADLSWYRTSQPLSPMPPTGEAAAWVGTVKGLPSLLCQSLGELKNGLEALTTRSDTEWTDVIWQTMRRGCCPCKFSEWWCLAVCKDLPGKMGAPCFGFTPTKDDYCPMTIPTTITPRHRRPHCRHHCHKNTAHHASAAAVNAVEKQPPRSCHSDPMCDEAAQGHTTARQSTAHCPNALPVRLPPGVRVSRRLRANTSGERTLSSWARIQVFLHTSQCSGPLPTSNYMEQK